MNTRTRQLTLILSSFAFSSCIIDTHPLGYRIRNCTNDTLLIDINTTDSLSDDIYWNVRLMDSESILPDDTTSVYIHGKKVNINNFYRVLPYADSGGFYPLTGDTCYVHIVKWQVVTHHSTHEIRSKRLYKSVALPKRDFGSDRVYEYKSEDRFSNNR